MLKKRNLYSFFAFIIVITGFYFLSQRFYHIFYTPQYIFFNKIIETLNLIAFLGIFLTTFLLGKNIRSVILEFIGNMFMSIGILEFIYIIYYDTYKISIYHDYEEIIFLSLFVKTIVVLTILFAFIYFKKDEETRRIKKKTIYLVNILIAAIGNIFFLSIMYKKRYILIDIPYTPTFIKHLWEGLLLLISIISIHLLIKKNILQTFCKNGIRTFLLSFSASQIILIVFPQVSNILNITAHALIMVAYNYIFINVFIASVLRHYEYLRKLFAFSEEVLKEKLDYQKSFSMLVDFIYENFSDIFTNISFYYKIDSNTYKLIYTKENKADNFTIFNKQILNINKEGLEKFNEIDIIYPAHISEVLANASEKDVNLLFTNSQFLMVKVYNNKDLVGLLFCQIPGKKFKLTQDIVEGMFIFRNFSKALIKQIERIEKIRALSVEDELTGLYNRRYFLKELVSEALLFERTGLKFCVAFFDMDNLKPLNDIYGHATGDIALKIIADTIKANIRKIDVAARFGGDEFVVLFKNCSVEGIKVRVEQIKKIIEERSSNELPSPIKVSCGIASYPDDTKSLDELLVVADNRMYEDKMKHKKEGGDD